MLGEQNFFRYLKGEVNQNDFFISLLAWSLRDGPTVLNAIHEELTFGHDAEILATQHSGLPSESSEYSGQRVLDWVVGDGDKLVGYESKTGNGSPSESQLSDEWYKLEANSGSKEIRLFAITDHAEQPASIEESPAEWLSWYQVADRILRLDTDDKAVQMLQEMFRDSGYEGFSGFTEFEQDSRWLTRHGDEFVDLAYEVARYLDRFEMYTKGNNHFYHSSTDNIEKVRNKSWATINQAHLTVHFYPDEDPDYVDDYYRVCLFLPALENDLRVYMDSNAHRNDSVKEFIQENSTGLATMVEERGMHLRTSWNALNNPDDQFLDYDSSDEIVDVLSEKAGTDNWRRLMFGWKVSVDQQSQQIVREAAERIEELGDLFFGDSEYFSKGELPMN